MKSFKHYYCLFLLIFGVFESCKKSTPAVLDAASSVSGTYKLSHYEEGGATYALPIIIGTDTTWGTIAASKINANAVKLTFSLNKNAMNLLTDTSSTVNLTSTSSGNYNMTSATSLNLGTIGNNLINLNGKLKTSVILATGKKR